ncbi:hypothetical protein F4808DRAFT_421318 [Astrocystis sublimbata]|nr:hypothetical protein F4808DRAFT_421318 [Astrocystis sublimbata]
MDTIISKTLTMPFPLTKVIRLRQSTWPNPAKSIGSAHGYTQDERLSYWSAEGPARAAYEILIPKIKSVLEDKQRRISGLDLMWWEVYMIGRTTSTSAPFLMFSCPERRYRRTAVKHIRESMILKDYPGMQTGEWPEPPHIGRQIQMASHKDIFHGALEHVSKSIVVEAFFDHKKQASALVTFRSANSVARATLSVHIKLRGEIYYLVPYHVLDRLASTTYDNIAENIRHGYIEEESVENDGCDFGDLIGDRDLGSDSPYSHEFQSEEPVGENPLSGRQWDSWTRDIAQGDINSPPPPRPLFEQLPDELPPFGSILPPPKMSLSPGSKSIPLVQTDTQNNFQGAEIWPPVSARLDYALVRLPGSNTNVNRSILPGFFSLSVMIAEPDVDGSQVTVLTSHGCLYGLLLRTKTQICFPTSTSYQEVYIAHFDSPVVSGDCGAMVYATSGGKIFGHLVTGSANSELKTAFVIPAKDFHMDIIDIMGFIENHYGDDWPSLATIRRTDIQLPVESNDLLSQEHSTTSLPRYETLESWFASIYNHPRTEKEAFDLLDDLIQVLDYLGIKYHDVTYVVHHNIKPTNIFVSKDIKRPYRRCFHLGDTGIVKNLEANTSRRESGSKDQGNTLDSRESNWAIDIWSLGCVFFELAVWMCLSERARLDFHDKLVKLNKDQNSYQDLLYDDMLITIMEVEVKQINKIGSPASRFGCRLMEFVLNEMLRRESKDTSPIALSSRLRSLRIE